MGEYLSGVYGNPPQEMAPEAAAHAGSGEIEQPSQHDLDTARAEGLAASEEDLLLVALFGEDAHRLLLILRNRGDRDDVVRDGLERAQSERIRELIEMVEDSEVGELTLEDAGVRITVKKQEQRPASAPVAAAPVAGAPASEAAAAENGAADGASVAIKIESPMVGTFYSSPSPSADPFVAEGDRVEVGQTIAILEAMKLFNELKSEHAGVIRSVLVHNAEPVEFGQPLFELELA
jgi:oxaloacetate decarboxylase alpha subunit